MCAAGLRKDSQTLRHAKIKVPLIRVYSTEHIGLSEAPFSSEAGLGQNSALSST